MATRVTLAELCDKLGVGYALGPYQTHPWAGYDPATGRHCNAEVRMSPDGHEIDAEAQMMFDAPEPGKPAMEQICHIRAKRSKDETWSVVALTLKGAPYGAGIHDWEGKACAFFAALVSHLLMDEIPDIDELIEEHFHSKERFQNQRQGGGGKAPKARAGQLLGMKRGGGGF